MGNGALKLGEILVRGSAITPPQLDEALAAQVVHGGRLGTNLVELGITSLDIVGQALGHQHGVPVAESSVLAAVGSAALGAVPKHLCARHGALPLQLSAGALDIAMLDPHDLTAVNKIGVEVGLTLRPHAVPQLRLLYYLEHHYAVPRTKRYLRLPDGHVQASAVPPQERRRYLTPTPDPIGTTLGQQAVTGPARPAVSKPAGPPPGPPAVEMPPIAGQPALEPGAARGPLAPPGVYAQQGAASSAGQRERVDSAPPVAAPMPPAQMQVSSAEIELVMLDQFTARPPDDFDIDISFDEDDAADAAPHSIGEAVAALCAVEDREQLVRQLVRPVVDGTALNALFLPRGDLLLALAAWGSKMPPWQVRALVLPISADPLVQRAIAQRKVVVDRVGDVTIQPMIAYYLQGAAPKQVCITPICLQDKVVNVLCTHAIEGLAPDASAAASKLAEAAATAYARLIMKLRKQG